MLLALTESVNARLNLVFNVERFITTGVLQFCRWQGWESKDTSLSSRDTVSSRSQDSVFIVLVLRVIVLVSALMINVLVLPLQYWLDLVSRDQDSSRHLTTDEMHHSRLTVITSRCSDFVAEFAFIHFGHIGHSALCLPLSVNRLNVFVTLFCFCQNEFDNLYY